jgi:hypothetical protein
MKSEVVINKETMVRKSQNGKTLRVQANSILDHVHIAMSQTALMTLKQFRLSLKISCKQQWVNM